jgi:hypothetical protein
MSRSGNQERTRERKNGIQRCSIWNQRKKGGVSDYSLLKNNERKASREHPPKILFGKQRERRGFKRNFSWDQWDKGRASKHFVMGNI